MTLPLLSVSDGVLSIPLKGIEFVMAGSTLIYNIVQKEREEEKICEKFIFQIPIDAFSKQFAKYITYAVRSFLRLRRHPGELILNWQVTFFEYLGVWTCFDFLCSSLSSIFLFSVKSADLLQYAFFSAFAFTDTHQNRVGRLHFFTALLFALCLLPLRSSCAFCYVCFQYYQMLCAF